MGPSYLRSSRRPGQLLLHILSRGVAHLLRFAEPFRAGVGFGNVSTASARTVDAPGMFEDVVEDPLRLIQSSQMVVRCENRVHLSPRWRPLLELLRAIATESSEARTWMLEASRGPRRPGPLPLGPATSSRRLPRTRGGIAPDQGTGSRGMNKHAAPQSAIVASAQAESHAPWVPACARITRNGDLCTT